MQDKIIYEDIDEDNGNGEHTTYSIRHGVFYIPELKSKMKAFKVMKHIKYSKPIIEFCFDKIKAEAVLNELIQGEARFC